MKTVNISPEIRLGSTRTSEGFRKTTTIEIGSRVLRMTTQNQAHVMDVVAGSLEPGTPVYIESIGSNCHTYNSWVEPALFVSDGTLDESGRFGVLKGKCSGAIADFNSDGSPVVHQAGEKYHKELSPAYSGTQPYYNEETFSPTRGYHGSLYTSGGIARVIVGGRATSIIDALDQIHFASDATKVQVPDFYRVANLLYSTTLQSRSERERKNTEKEQFEEEFAEYELMIFCKKMLERAMKQKDDDFDKRADLDGIIRHEYFSDTVESRQFSTYSDGDRPLQVTRDKDDYTILPCDVFFMEAHHPRRRLGYLRPNGQSFKYGGLFLPTNRRMDQVAKLAFDPEFVKTLYPEGYNLF